MNIRNDLPSIQPLVDSTLASAAGKPTSSAAASTVPDSDQTHLSGAASLAIHAASLSDVRSEKVASVQAAIADGSYNVSSADVAHSLISHMLDSQ
jgi:negative regulator of flagellin synthesis FlgM